MLEESIAHAVHGLPLELLLSLDLHEAHLLPQEHRRHRRHPWKGCPGETVLQQGARSRRSGAARSGPPNRNFFIPYASKP